MKALSNVADGGDKSIPQILFQRVVWRQQRRRTGHDDEDGDDNAAEPDAAAGGEQAACGMDALNHGAPGG